jgi:type I restriction enzyme M protein
MVDVTDPRFGETILDPAAGTGGFLVETFNRLSKQVKTVAHRKLLQDESIFGCEPKSLPYLLCQMNLLLHGLDAPHVDPENALRFKLSEIGEKDRVDVTLTNPPVGGEEEKGIQGNFPDDSQTAETALCFSSSSCASCIAIRHRPAGRRVLRSSSPTARSSAMAFVLASRKSS